MDKSIDIVVKGNVITLANQQPRAEAIGIKGEKIVSVSSLKEIEASVDKATKFIDLTGKTILPGFIDTHTHALATGRSRLGVDLSSVSSISETLTRIKDRCKKLRRENGFFAGNTTASWSRKRDFLTLLNWILFL